MKLIKSAIFDEFLGSDISQWSSRLKYPVIFFAAISLTLLGLIVCVEITREWHLSVGSILNRSFDSETFIAIIAIGLLVTLAIFATSRPPQKR
ncbi:hypothetical protein C7W93_09045 [Glaciimonas sp. PCH181]|nr:hypothetical protein C7W93_09045 [Glaciimonas sp. PCH181]